MSVHGLTPKTMDKLLTILVERGILTQDQIEQHARMDEGPQTIIDAGPQTMALEMGQQAMALDRTAHLKHIPDSAEIPNVPASSCPQCGAGVLPKALTCPECGHLLSGAERWGALEDEAPIWQRLPPLLIGCVIALPAALLMVYVFFYILYPMMEAAEQRKVQQRQEVKAAKNPKPVAQDKKGREAKNKAEREQALQAKKAALDDALQELVERGALAGLDDNYRVYRAGPAWSTISEADKYSGLARIQAAMKQAKVRVDFEVRDLWGYTVARVTEQAVIVGEQQGAGGADNPVTGPEPEPRRP